MPQSNGNQPSKIDRRISAAGSIATVIATIIVGVGLVFTYLQLKDGANAQRAASTTAKHALEAHLQEQMTSLDKYFAGHPSLRKFFYENADPGTSGTRANEAASVSEMIIDLAATVTPSAKDMPRARYNRWQRTFQAYYCPSPVLRREWRKMKEYYSPDTAKLLTSDCKQT